MENLNSLNGDMDKLKWIHSWWWFY